MAKHRIVTSLVAIALLSASTMSYAFSLSDVLGSNSPDQAATQIADNPLTKALTTELNIKPAQAAGGAGALLSMAADQLSGEQNQELAKLIPGANKLTDSLPLGFSQLLGNKENIDKIFSMLGMSPDMVNKFSSVLTQFLSEQGASNALLTTLKNAWAPAAK